MEVRSFSEFVRRFGKLSAALETGYAVHQYFLNGGRTAWVVRVARDPSTHQLLRGLHALDEVDLFNLLVLPGGTTPARVALTADYCQRRRAFLLVDSPASAKTPAQIEEAAQSLVFDSASHAAIYYPWIQIADPLNPSLPRLSPPGGTIAGLIARMDNTRGVWKAPAGTEANLTGVTSLERDLTDAEIGRLNPRGVNCLRSLPVHGPVAWGARTLAGNDLTASEFKYIPVRRTALFIEESLARGIQWAVSRTERRRAVGAVAFTRGRVSAQPISRGRFPGRYAP